MNFKKIITLLLAFALTLSLAACGSKGDGKGDSDTQGATAEEIYAQIQELADKENAIMEENLELWQKLFAAMNEKRDEIPDESNYGSYLLAALDLVKDKFTEDELKTLTEGSEKIRDLEDQIQPLQEQYAALQNSRRSDAIPLFRHRMADVDAAGGCIVLQARGGIDHIADGGVCHILFVTHMAQQCRPRVDADAQADLQPRLPIEPGRKILRLALYRQCSLTGIRNSLRILVQPPVGHGAIAHKFIHNAAVPVYAPAGQRKEVAKAGNQLCRRQVFR